MGSTKRKNRKDVLKSIKRLQENLKVLQSLKK